MPNLRLFLLFCLPFTHAKLYSIGVFDASDASGEHDWASANPYDLVHYAYAHVQADGEHLDNPTIAIAGEVKVTPSQFISDMQAARTVPSLRIGGQAWASSRSFSSAMSSDIRRKNFAANIKKFLEMPETAFGGVNIYWLGPNGYSAICEFPFGPPLSLPPPDDTLNLKLFLRDLRQELGDSKIITITAPSLPWKDSAKSPLTDVTDHAAEVNYIEISAFDFTGPLENRRRQVFSSAPAEWNCQSVLPYDATVATSIEAWVTARAPVEKLILVVPAYGRKYHVSMEISPRIPWQWSFYSEIPKGGPNDQGDQCSVDTRTSTGITNFRDLVQQGYFLASNMYPQNVPDVGRGIEVYKYDCDGSIFYYKRSDNVVVSFESNETIDFKKDQLVRPKNLRGFQITPANGDYKSIMKTRWNWDN